MQYTKVYDNLNQVASVPMLKPRRRSGWNPIAVAMRGCVISSNNTKSLPPQARSVQEDAHGQLSCLGCVRSVAFTSLVALCLCGSLFAAKQQYIYNRIDFPTGTESSGVAVADFHGDGKMELAVASFANAISSICRTEVGAPNPTKPGMEMAGRHGVVALFALMGLTACGVVVAGVAVAMAEVGGSVTGTPAGTYTLTVTASVSSGANVPHSVTLTLVVN